MTVLRPYRFFLWSLVALTALASAAVADEGMWTFNRFPFARFEQTYGFRPTQEWLDHLRLASVRFNSGGSGSFVSADGLVITNHHVGLDCIQKLSSGEHDYVHDGFVAASTADERPCPDLELNVLVGIETVTERVRAVAKPEMSAAEAFKAQRAEMAAIEQECQDSTGLRCDVVTLYKGGEYDLYRYRRYTDVRLAFAPEFQAAFFGGDPDNFEYPRYCLDVSLFRVYENGQPIHPEHYLRWSSAGAQEGEVTFVSGHPGSTGRLLTQAQLAWQRDTVYPLTLSNLQRGRSELLLYRGRGAEQARIAGDDYFGVENSIKALSGYQSGLLDVQLMTRKAEEEAALRAAVRGKAEAAGELDGDPWQELADSLESFRTYYPRFSVLESELARAGQLAGIARRLVRLVVELEKPSGERLREYRETALPSLYQQLYSPAPIYPDYEEFQLAEALRTMEAQLGPTHPIVVAVLGPRTAEEVARTAIAGTRLGDIATRKALAEGGKKAMEASDDPLLLLMRAAEPLARELRERFDHEVDAVDRQAGAEVAEAFFAVHGQETYPDATFTLRLTFGEVSGYEEGGRQIPYHTDFGGLLAHAEAHRQQPPYDLPAALVRARDRVDPKVPVNFVATHDIIGGNSGSPVVNRGGEFVGIIFDGNLYNLPNRFVYTEERARSIAVDSRAILEALRQIYPAGHLAGELLAGGK